MRAVCLIYLYIIILYYSQNGEAGSNYEKATVAQAKRIMKPFVLRRLKRDVSFSLCQGQTKINLIILIVCLVHWR